jgi:hypothetical protein
MTEPFALCFPVLTPFKFRGVIVKPPAFVQMERDEARPYFYAGVIGTEQDSALVPDAEAEAEAQRLADEQADAERKAAEAAEAQRQAEEQAAADQAAKGAAEAQRLADEQAAADAKAAEAAKKAAAVATAANKPATTRRGARNPNA